LKKIVYSCFLVLFISVNNNIYSQKKTFFEFVDSFDLKIYEYVNSKKLMSTKNSQFLDNYGKIYIYPLVVYSELKYNKNQKFLLNPLVLTISSTYFLKYITKRERPNKKNKMSFPSGHTSGSFVSALILNNNYGLSIGLPALFLASVVGIQRLESNNHWFSDVMSGAIIGLFFGIIK
tara:strand:+ start:85855 stop:86385 length:531 start_codon:yes stop_codon:yes gene_type:complete